MGNNRKLKKEDVCALGYCVKFLENLTLKDYIYQLSEETRKEADELKKKEKEIERYEFVRLLARNTGKLQLLNKIMQFIIDNKI